MQNYVLFQPKLQGEYAYLHNLLGCGVLSWDHFRYFLAVARGGTTVAAAEKLRVNQSTVSRQIVALERAIGVKLFDKTARGYELTFAGQEVLPAAERIDMEFRRITSVVRQTVRRAAGTIKVTTNETIADLFLTPLLKEFSKLYPDIRVIVSVSAHWEDLSNGEADVALRAAQVLQGEGIVARRLSNLPWTLYCSRDYLASHGSPARPDDLREHSIIGVYGHLETVAVFQWLEQNSGHAAIVSRTNSLPNLLAAIRSGLGISALPSVTGESHPELVRCLGPQDELQSTVWLITRRRIKDEPRIRAFNSFVASKAPLLRRLLNPS